MAPAAAPLAKTNELIDRLRELTTRAAAGSDELSDIRDQASQMARSRNPEIKASGFMIGGIVAALEMRLADVERLFRAAEGWTDAENLPICRANYVASLHRTAQYAKAAEVSPKLVEAWPDNQVILEVAIDVCSLVLDFDSKKVLMKRWRDLGFQGGEDDPNDPVILERLAAEGITPAAFLERLDGVGSVLRDRGVRTVGVDSALLSSGVLVHRCLVLADVDTAVDLNFAIAENLAEKFDDPFDRVICFGVIPYVEDGA